MLDNLFGQFGERGNTNEAVQQKRADWDLLRYAGALSQLDCVRTPMDPVRLRYPAPEIAPAARAVHQRLVEAGEVSLLAGGVVRDHLLGRPAHDVDLASSATPERVAELFAKTIMVGAHFGVAKVIHDGEEVEVVTFRTDLEYQDGRRPLGVCYSNPEEDAKRRDFTINGLFYDLEEECVVDYVGGLRDLDSRRLRAIGDAGERFREDRLRMMRAVRFATVLGFPIEPATWDAILAEASFIGAVSAERICVELEKTLLHPRRELGFFLLSDSGLMRHILPEVEAMRDVPQPPEFHPEGDVHRHTAMVLSHLHDPDWPLVLGALLHDVAKPVTFSVTDRIRFNKHDTIGAQMAEEICERLRMSRKDREEVAFLVRRHMLLPGLDQMREARRQRLFDESGFEALLDLGQADCLGSHGHLDSVEKARELYSAYRARGPRPEPLLRGRDLIAAGLSPGPALGKILSQVEDAQREGLIQDQEQALEFARTHFGSLFKT